MRRFLFAIVLAALAAASAPAGNIARPPSSGTGNLLAWDCGADPNCAIVNDGDSDGDYGDDVQRVLNELLHPSLTETVRTNEAVSMTGLFTSPGETVDQLYAKSDAAIAFDAGALTATVNASTGAIEGGDVETTGTPVVEFDTTCGSNAFCSSSSTGIALSPAPILPDSVVCEVHDDGDPAGPPDQSVTFDADGNGTGDVSVAALGVRDIGGVKEADGTYTIIWSGAVGGSAAQFCDFTGNRAANRFDFKTSAFSFGWASDPGTGTNVDYTQVEPGAIPAQVRIFPPQVASETLLGWETPVVWCRGLPYDPPQGYETPVCEATQDSDQDLPRLIFAAPWQEVWLGCDLSTSIAATDGRHFCLKLGDNHRSSNVRTEDFSAVETRTWLQWEMQAGPLVAPVVASPMDDYIGSVWLDGLIDSRVRFRFRDPAAGAVSHATNTAALYGSGKATRLEIETSGQVDGVVVIDGNTEGLVVDAKTQGLTHHIGTRGGVNPPFVEFIDDAAGCRLDETLSTGGELDTMECRGFTYRLETTGTVTGSDAVLAVSGFGDGVSEIDVSNDALRGEVVELSIARAAATVPTRYSGTLRVRCRGWYQSDCVRFHPANEDVSPILTGTIEVDAGPSGGASPVIAPDAFSGLAAARYVNRMLFRLTGFAGIGGIGTDRVNANYSMPGPIVETVHGTTYPFEISGQGALGGDLCVVFQRGLLPDPLPALQPALADCAEEATALPRSTRTRFLAWGELEAEAALPSTNTACRFIPEIDGALPQYEANGQRLVYGGTAAGATGTEFRDPITAADEGSRLPFNAEIPPGAAVRVRVTGPTGSPCVAGASCACDGITLVRGAIHVDPLE